MSARKLFIYFLLAVLLGVGVATLKAQEDGDIPVYYPGLCWHLPKYGYWWYFFACHLEENNLTVSQDVTLVLDGDVLTTDIYRTHHDGSVTWIRRQQRQKAK